MTTIIRLLKSWAMPPANRPMASIFCECWSAWAVRLCLVISVIVSMMWVRPSVVGALAQCTRRNWLPDRGTSLETTVSLAIASGIRQKSQGVRHPAILS